MYYFRDGKKFGSKIQAIQYEEKSGLEPNFYYFDEIYDKVNWTVEPPLSLNEYYKQQAQRIRDNYDYVILCYSGGYDSTNILETFYYNGIKLDKIVIVGAFSQDSSSMVDENHNGELYNNAFPYVDYLGLSSITEVIDYTKLFNDINQFSITEFQNEWVHEIGGWFSPHNFFWRDAEKFLIPSEYSNKKCALVFGKDKPYISIENRKFGFRFKDVSITSYGNRLTSYTNCDRINFYWDPYFPNILVKQLHVLLRKYILSKFKFGHANGMGYDIIGKVSSNDIIYDLKRPLKYKSPKSKSKIISLRDTYLMNHLNSDIYKFHQSGIEYMKKNLSSFDLNTYHSKFYSIT